MNIIKMNRMIIKAMSDRDYNGFKTFVDSFVEDITTKEYDRLFESKLYIWNILRTKDFYKLFSRYIIERVNDERLVSKEVAQLITRIIVTTKEKAIKYDFCRNLNRNGKYILTIGTLLCLHDLDPKEGIQKILESADFRYVYTDEFIKPFIAKIKKDENMITILTTT